MAGRDCCCICCISRYLGTKSKRQHWPGEKQWHLYHPSFPQQLCTTLTEWNTMNNLPSENMYNIDRVEYNHTITISLPPTHPPRKWVQVVRNYWPGDDDDDVPGEECGPVGVVQGFEGGQGWGQGLPGGENDPLLLLPPVRGGEGPGHGAPPVRKTNGIHIAQPSTHRILRVTAD